MAEDKDYSPEELNFFRVCSVTTKIITPGLREVFKREWNTRYEGTYDAWEDTAQNGIDFYSNESGRNRNRHFKELDTLQIGNTLECDCTCLFFAILYSDSIGRNLDPAVKEGVNDLRVFRNECFAHLSSGELTEAEFQTSIQKVITAFTKLKLDTSDINEVRNQKTFPIKELRVTQELLEKEKMRNEEPQPFCVLPPKPSHQVFHREEEIKSILQEMEKLRSTKPNEITVIYLSGNPGSGKSEIARQIGEKVFDDVPDKETETKFVFTLNASSMDALLESYVEFAVSLKCDENSTTSIRTSEKLSQEAKLIHLKSLVAPKLRKYSSWLLIVDNVTDLKSVFRYLPKAGEKIDGKGQMLVTTQDSRSIADDCYTYHLSLSRGMNHDEVTRMLSLISGIAADDEIKELQVAKALDLQPLALACAAIYMRRVRMTTPTFSWQEYLQKLQKGKREVTEGEYKKISVAYSQTMTAAVKLAIEKEVEEDAVMLHAFNFLSVMAPETIPLEYVVQYVTRSLPDEDKEDVAANVTSSSLILSSEGQSQEIRIHQVVHGFLNTVVRPQMNEIEEFHFLLNVIQAFSTFLDSFDENNVNSIMATKSLVVHFVLISKKLSLYLTNPNSILEIPFSEEDNGLHCLLSTGRICKIHGKYEEAHNLFKITLIIKEKIYGKNHPALTSTLNGLGISLYHLDQQKEAKTCIERALAIQEIASDPNHPVLVSTLNLLGGILDNHEEANAYIVRALTIQEKASDENHPVDLAPTLNNLGNNFVNLGKYKEASWCFERALAIEEIVFGPNHPAVASILSNLGNSLDYLAQYKEAESCFERALAIEEMVFGPNHPAVASTLSNLGNSLGGLEQYRRAKTCFERALAIEEMVYGQNHSAVASTLSNLSNILGDLGKHEEAKSCLERALAIEEMNFGPNHQDLASTLSNLGYVLRDLNKHEEAKYYLERALAIEEMSLPTNHPDLASTLMNLGKVLRDLGKPEEAKSCLERALAIEEMNFGPNHRYLASTLMNLGKVLRDLGKHEEAKSCLERALAIEEMNFGPNHKDLASTLRNLGNVLRDLGKHEEAKSCLERALAIEEMNFGPNHQDLASTLRNLGKVLRDLGKHEEAKSCLERALAIEEMNFGPNHKDLASTLRNLVKVLRDLGKHEEAKCCLERELAIEEMNFGPNHPDLASTLRNLGNILGDLGKYEAAKSCLERALAIEEIAFGPNHPELASTLRNLGDVLDDLGKHEEAKSCLERALAIEEMDSGQNHPDLA